MLWGIIFQNSFVASYGTVDKEILTPKYSELAILGWMREQFVSEDVKMGQRGDR